MTTTKNKISNFKSREEEVAWFEAQTAEYWNKAKPVDIRFTKNLSAGLNFWFDSDSLPKIRSVAREKVIVVRPP